jgi:hypothetical protein
VHTSPATPGFGYVRLKSEYYSAQYQNWLATPAPYRSWGVRISGTHLDRDLSNKLRLNDPLITPLGLCRGAAQHAWDGNTAGLLGVAPSSDFGSSVKIYEAGPNPSVPATTPLNLSLVNRRGFIMINNNHCATSLGGDSIWEYNGLSSTLYDPNRPYPSDPEDIHGWWGISSLTAYTQLLFDPYHPDPNDPESIPSCRKITIMMYFPPPSN